MHAAHPAGLIEMGKGAFQSLAAEPQQALAASAAHAPTIAVHRVACRHLFIAELAWLGEALERVRPNARTFVRPGFDEPEAVATVLAAERGGG